MVGMMLGAHGGGQGDEHFISDKSQIKETVLKQRTKVCFVGRITI